MTDPNLPPVTPPPTNQPPIYQPPAAPAYGAPAAPAYGQGGAYAQPYAQAPSDKYNVLAIVSLVSAFFISLVAIITGHIALSQIKKTGEKGRGLAIGGLVLGYLGVLATIIVIIVWFVVIAAAVNDGSISGY
ncbi:MULTISPECIES: DUF4190 domain-containing protein [Cryobacterium]|uniref:DUF4190 domain-containing protein n=1 Tax=Cryobacterium mannosilyticum TaxID=1259190 RepID=A0A4R8WDH0_9MICO|nr:MULTISPECIES: DUF4190 domain-containing protein [Cryobacterium]TFB96912.1 DUF4190 domain-containing protein [Cryobacterium sp. HLT2-28]TFC04550.1 DUF4190 domain-containing protein [Cryobacterium mannosilyticum]